MNCDEYCCNNGCNQGRDCPARKPGQTSPAKVAVAKPMYRRCDVLGVCQNQHGQCASHCELYDEIEPDPTDTKLNRVMTWLAFALSAIVLGAVLAFLSGLHSDLIIAWFEWLHATLQLTLYRWANAWS